MTMPEQVTIQESPLFIKIPDRPETRLYSSPFELDTSGGEVQVMIAGKNFSEYLGKGAMLGHEDHPGWVYDRIDGAIYGDVYRLEFSLKAVIGLCHDAGHTLVAPPGTEDPNVSKRKANADVVYKHYKKQEVKPATEILDLLVENFNLELQDEMEGWTAGQPLMELVGALPQEVAYQRALSVSSYYYEILAGIPDWFKTTEHPPAYATLEIMSPKLDGSKIKISYQTLLEERDKLREYQYQNADTLNRFM